MSDSDSSESSLQEDYGIKPYMFEPKRTPEEKEKVLKELKAAKQIGNQCLLETIRVGNKEWCLCSMCRCMPTEIESLCCRENNDIPDDLFQGKTFEVLAIKAV